jgi:hypothetical protein
VIRRLLLLGAVVVVVAGLAACGSSSPSASSSSSGSPSTTAARTGDPVAAYREAVAAYDAAADPPDPDAPGLVAAYTGDALLKARVALGRSRADGIAARGARSVVTAAVTAQDAASATIAACVRDDQERYRTSDGTVVAPVTGATAAVVVTLTSIDGRWAVSAIAPGEGC